MKLQANLPLTPSYHPLPYKINENQKTSVHFSGLGGSVVKDVRAPYYASNIIAFRGGSGKDYTEQDYENAKAYIEGKSRGLSEYSSHHIAEAFDLDKLNGIQRGIKVFKGLSMQEIAFALRGTSFAVNRGCHNNCAHCLAFALPKDKQSGHLLEMSWEDFKQFNEGAKEISQRLRDTSDRSIKFSNADHLTPYHDSDCIGLQMFDKKGNEYDFRHIADEMSKSFGEDTITFSTAGWSPKNKKHQKRAEEIAQYFSNDENIKKISKFYVSITPFHPLLTKSLEFKKSGDDEKAQKFRDLYVEMMANTLFTFTPVFHRWGNNHSKFGLLMHAFDDDINDPKIPDEVKESHFRGILDDIFKELKCKYNEDLNSQNPKYDLHWSHPGEYIRRFRDEDISTHIIYGRGVDSFGLNSEPNFSTIASSEEPESLLLKRDSHNDQILDTDGKLWFVSDGDLYHPTQVQLNFQNKDKPTRPFPNTDDSFVITKEMIKKAYAKEYPDYFFRYN